MSLRLKSVTIREKINLYDTSAIVEASQRGILIDPGYTIPVIQKEMYNFLPGNGRNGAHINPNYLKNISTKLPTCNESGFGYVNDMMNVREDVIYANERVNEGKKTENDIISQSDIALISKAIILAKHGNHVDFYSEDGHITNTIEDMLNISEYSDLRDLLSVKSYRVGLAS